MYNVKKYIKKGKAFMNYKNISIVLLLCIINNVHAKRTGITKAPVTQPTQPRPQIIQPQQQPAINPFEFLPKYTQILYILKDKTPDSSDFSTLKNIRGEADTQIKLIQERKPDLRAKVFNIKTADDIETYSDIYNALKQNSADSSDFSTLNNIKNEAEKQMRQLEEAVQKKPVVQPVGGQLRYPVVGELRYSEILSALKKNVPDSADFSTLNNIVTEATRQRDSLIRK